MKKTIAALMALTSAAVTQPATAQSIKPTPEIALGNTVGADAPQEENSEENVIDLPPLVSMSLPATAAPDDETLVITRGREATGRVYFAVRDPDNNVFLLLVRPGLEGLDYFLYSIPVFPHTNTLMDGREMIVYGGGRMGNSIQVGGEDGRNVFYRIEMDNLTTGRIRRNNYTDEDMPRMIDQRPITVLTPTEQTNLVDRINRGEIVLREGLDISRPDNAIFSVRDPRYLERTTPRVVAAATDSVGNIFALYNNCAGTIHQMLFIENSLSFMDDPSAPALFTPVLSFNVGGNVFDTAFGALTLETDRGHIHLNTELLTPLDPARLQHSGDRVRLLDAPQAPAAPVCR